MPDDISIIGFDDKEISSHITPALTTMHVPTKKMGSTAGNIMFDIFSKGRSAGKKVVIKPELVERESVRKI